MSKNTSPSLIRPCLRLAHLQLVPQSGSPICGDQGSNAHQPFHFFSDPCAFGCVSIQDLPMVNISQLFSWSKASLADELALLGPTCPVVCPGIRWQEDARGNMASDQKNAPRQFVSTTAPDSKSSSFVKKNITETTCQHSVSRLLISSHICLLCRLMVQWENLLI